MQQPSNTLLFLLMKAVNNGLTFKFVDEMYDPKIDHTNNSMRIIIYNDYSDEQIVHEIETKLKMNHVSPYKELFEQVKNIVEIIQAEKEKVVKY